MEELTTEELSMVVQGLQQMVTSTHMSEQTDLKHRIKGYLTESEFDANQKWFQKHREYLTSIIKKIRGF